MAEKTNKRKLATSAIALATAAALLLGGTLAWQSISQEATNIVSAAVNPGGRLHDDFDGSNDKNVYVENFGTQNIYARIKLSEYLEIGQNAGNFEADADRTDVVQHLGTDVDDKTTYETYLYGGDNISDQYWEKDWEGGTKYIPTFNKDQDSLEADLNGTYENTADVDNDGTAEPYEDFVDYNTAAADYSETDTEWYDADTNDTAEEHVNPDSVTAGSHDVVENANHTLADSLNGTVISMTDWDGTAGDYWVYDADGWAYWANPIAPGTATGLLLDSITDLGYIDEDYYYAIHVTGQFITAGDLGDTDSTGFYQNADEKPSDAALNLLKTIGVKVGEEENKGVWLEPVSGSWTVERGSYIDYYMYYNDTRITNDNYATVLADLTVNVTTAPEFPEGTPAGTWNPEAGAFRLSILESDPNDSYVLGVTSSDPGSTELIYTFEATLTVVDPVVTEPEYSIAVLSRTVDNGYDDPYEEEYPGYMMSNDTWTFSLEENGAASDEAVTWSIAETPVAGDGKLDGTVIDASTGVMTVADGESMGSNNYMSYDVFKVTASNDSGNILAEQNILVCDYGILREKLAFYENDVHVTGALEPGKTYDVGIATQECGTSTDVSGYLDPISPDNVNSVGVSQYNGSETVDVTDVYYENGKFIVGEDASGYYTLSLSIGSSSGMTQTIYVQSAAVTE